MDDIEKQLRRYRPVGPPPDLRGRIVAASGRPVAPLWLWMPPAAAALAAIVFHLMAVSVRRDLAADLPGADASREAFVRLVGTETGDVAAARAIVLALDAAADGASADESRQPR